LQWFELRLEKGANMQLRLMKDGSVQARPEETASLFKLKMEELIRFKRANPASPPPFPRSAAVSKSPWPKKEARTIL
jgi:hypothetical protein